MVRECLQKDGTLGKRTDLSVDQIVELITICLKTTHYSYSNTFYTTTWLHYGLCGFLPLLSICTWIDLSRKFWEITLALRLDCGFETLTTSFIIINKRESDNFIKYIIEVDPNI